MSQVKDGDKWVTLVFNWTEAGVPRTTLVQLNAHDTGSPLTDRSISVATILYNALAAQGGYVLTRAESVQEVVVNLIP